MQTMTLSRKDRRRRAAKAAKLYGLSGDKALIVHQAYDALFHKRLEQVVELIGPISRSDPKNKHPWIILGGTALEKIEGKTAKVFFAQAHAIAPTDPVVLGGMAKAHVLEAEVEPATRLMEQAFAAGNEDKGLVNLYLELMVRLGRGLKATDVATPVVQKLQDAELCYRLATILSDGDETNAAAFWYNRAFQLNPEKEEYQIGRLRSLLFSQKLAEVEELAQKLLQTASNRDDVVTIYLMALRLLGKYDLITEYCDTFKFTDIKAFALARGLMANVYQDLGQWNRVEPAYREAIHITGEPGKIAKAYGVYKYREREIAEGFPYYSDRFPPQNRKHIPLGNSAPDNLKQLSRIHLMGEQGIGDQLALLSLLRVAPIDPEETEVIYISDSRFDAVLKDNLLSVDFLSQDRFFNEPRSLQSNEMVYLGDLTQYLVGKEPEEIQGAYLVADETRVARLKKKYRALANGRPIIGVAWNSASLIGHMRSLPLIDILAAIPYEALVVNLQYGANPVEIQAANKLRPDIEFINDESVDQMTDLASFAAQIMTLDRVITIDNTTAHFCGALGHPDSHVLIPLGSETMWYWGREGSIDPWYGNLHLHRQTRLRDWSGPIESVRRFGHVS